MPPFNTRLKLGIIFGSLSVVIIFVTIFAFLYPSGPSVSEEESVSSRKNLIRALEESFSENTLLTENEDSGTSPQLFSEADGQFALFFLNSAKELRILRLDASGKPTDVSQIFEGGSGISSFALAQYEATGFLAFTRVRNARHEFVLTRLDALASPQSSQIVFSQDTSDDNFRDPNLAQFEYPFLAASADTLFLFTRTGDENNPFFRLRTFDHALHATGAEKDISVQKAKLTAGARASAVLLKDRNYIVTTGHRHGAPLCPQADGTTQTELVALAYDTDWNPVDDNLLLTDHKRVTHHPVSAATHDEKIFIAYFLNDPKKEFPQCDNGDILSAGQLMVSVYNTRWKNLQNLMIHDATNGTARDVHLLPLQNQMLVTFGVQQEQNSSTSPALLLRRYPFAY